MTARAALLLLVAVVLGARASPARPKYIGCEDSSECGAWECCMLGGGRYSTPKCVLLGDVGSPCRGGADAIRPTNTTVYYPDGRAVNLPAVFLHVCPCAPGLQCTAQPGPASVCAARDDHEYNEV